MVNDRTCGEEQRFKIVHILPWLGGGGVEQRRYLMAQYLNDAEYEQTLIYMNAAEDWPSLFEQQGVKTLHVPGAKAWAPTDFEAITAIARHLGHIKPDIVHGAVFEGVSMATLAGRLAGVPYIAVEETGDPDMRGIGGDLLMKIYGHLASACVGISTAATTYFENRLGISGKKVICIENGVRDIAPISKEERKEYREDWGLKQNDIVVGVVGRIHDSHKRYSVLIRLIAKLSRTYPNLKLLIVGSGKDLDLLRDQVAKLGIEDKVIFTGFQRDVRSFYGMMDIFALLSALEGAPLVVMEAMLAELPTVVTQVGAMHRLTVDGKTGFQVPGDTPEAAEAPLRKLIEDESLRNVMGAAGRERALEKYSHQAYIDRVDEFYSELIGVSDGRASQSPSST